MLENINLSYNYSNLYEKNNEISNLNIPASLTLSLDFIKDKMNHSSSNEIDLFLDSVPANDSSHLLGESMLKAAIESNKIDWTEKLLEHGVQAKWLPLAVKLNHFEIVKCLISHECNLFEIDEDGHWCFYYLKDANAIASFLIPVLKENLNLSSLIKDENFSKIVLFYIIPLLMMVDASKFEEYEYPVHFYQQAIKSIIIALGLINIPFVVYKLARDGEFWDAVEYTIPWLVSVIPSQNYLIKTILTALYGLNSIKRFICSDLDRSLSYFKKNRALAGAICLGSGAIRTAMAVLPFFQMGKNITQTQAPAKQHQNIKDEVMYFHPTADVKPGNGTDTCKVTIYAAPEHVSVGLECSQLNLNKTIGFYPEHLIQVIPKMSSSTVGKDSSLGLIIFLPTKGKLINEPEDYVASMKMQTTSKAVVDVTKKQMELLWNHITAFHKMCLQERWECKYFVLGSNCVDFAQGLFNKLGQSGHFFDYPMLGMQRMTSTQCYGKIQSFLMHTSLLSELEQNKEVCFNLNFLALTKAKIGEQKIFEVYHAYRKKLDEPSLMSAHSEIF